MSVYNSLVLPMLEIWELTGAAGMPSGVIFVAPLPLFLRARNKMTRSSFAQFEKRKGGPCNYYLRRSS